MKAIIHTQYGSPDLLQFKETVKPTPQPKELLIKIHACTVNRTDCAMLKASPAIMRLFMGLTKPINPILGTDFAGVVEAIGDRVSKYKVGDKVFGFNDMGLSSHAEYTCVKETETIALMPKSASFDQAAASIEGFHYARNIINKVKLKRGDHVLVIGATGAIGSACVQLLRYYGANITAVGKGEHSAKVLAMGAEKVIDYTTQDFTKRPNKYDYIFDAVGKSSFGQCKGLLQKNGCYISSELGPANENLYLPFVTKVLGGKRVKFPFPTDRDKSIQLVSQLMEEEAYSPLMDCTYTLEQIPAAFNYVLSGEKIGSVVIHL